MQSTSQARSGIYGIFGPSGKIYIGSAVNLVSRMTGHKNGLIKGCHHNSYLQNSWNKYGGESFHFVVLERCPGVSTKELIPREQFWIDKYRGSLYNQRHIAASSAGMKMTDENRLKLLACSIGRKWDAETKYKIGSANRGKKLPEDWCRKIGAAGVGRTWSPESRIEMSTLLRGKKRSEEGKANMRGKTGTWARSEEYKQSLLGKGKKLSDHQLEQMRLWHDVFGASRKSLVFLFNVSGAVIRRAVLREHPYSN